MKIELDKTVLKPDDINHAWNLVPFYRAQGFALERAFVQAIQDVLHINASIGTIEVPGDTTIFRMIHGSVPGTLVFTNTNRLK